MFVFASDLAFGKYWEERAIELAGGAKERAPEGAFKPWDFIGNDDLKYEVKSDRLAHRFGMKTMYIEYECSGKPSGIETTEADYWYYCMVNPNQHACVYKMPVSVVKELCKNPLRTVSGGDGGRSRGHIVQPPVEYCVKNDEMGYLLPPPSRSPIFGPNSE